MKYGVRNTLKATVKNVKEGDIMKEQPRGDALCIVPVLMSAL